MKTDIWAHRGASRQAPENTMKAFELAIAQGADGIELDVMRSKDQALVVTHDESCKRLTRKKGMVNQMTLNQLRQLDFAARHAEPSKQQIPLLEEVLALLKPTSLKLNIELKNSLHFDPGLELAVIELVLEHGMQDRVILSSFNHYSMQAAAKICAERAPALRCAILYSSEIVDVWEYAKKIGVQAVHPLYAGLQIPGTIENCHEAGLAVNAWTINSPEHIAMALQAGVDAIITDVPDTALAVRRKLELAKSAQ